MVPLFGYDQDVSSKLLITLIVSPLVHLKACKVIRKLGLDNDDRHLLPVRDMEPWGVNLGARLLRASRQPIASPDSPSHHMYGDNGKQERKRVKVCKYAASGSFDEDHTSLSQLESLTNKKESALWPSPDAGNWSLD
ncbi:hypothetical protein VE00_08929 [Pseudogymnoascus sp. WSF 3629]|nr:hypothetical protein VE00_08929 [Pseudogymnoascus sp. WSF 3629]